jgi:hypothetical protein
MIFHLVLLHIENCNLVDYQKLILIKYSSCLQYLMDGYALNCIYIKCNDFRYHLDLLFYNVKKNCMAPNLTSFSVLIKVSAQLLYTLPKLFQTEQEVKSLYRILIKFIEENLDCLNNQRCLLTFLPLFFLIIVILNEKTFKKMFLNLKNFFNFYSLHQKLFLTQLKFILVTLLPLYRQ